jgi:hypothetical protein
MVWLFSAGLWFLLALALWRCFQSWRDRPVRVLEAALGLLAVLVVAVPFYFRPHEDLLNSEASNSSLNAAATFARTGQLTYTDELLAKLPEADRPAFFYGPDTLGPTKDACLWVKNLRTAEIGPRYQPAYPVLLSLPLKLLPAWCVLYVTPLLTLLVALALAALAMQLFGQHRGGILAMPFFLLNPVVLWTGRSACAEWGAVLFFWLGLALLARAWRCPASGALPTSAWVPYA